MKQNQFEFKPFDQVLVRNTNEQIWKPNFYSFEGYNSSGYVCTNDMKYTQCIPYNEETKHLLGTSLPYEESVKEPKEYHEWTSGTFNEWFTKAEFENFIKTAVINNKDIKDFHVLYVKHND